ncbi:MAG: DedA family protein [Bacteroidota bacterium]|nr:DedA family protein [Bacteroidota bacterium]
MGFYQQFIEWVIYHGGLYVVLLIIFAETGLFVGFFLPGDSLLFTTGIYINEVASNFFNVHYDVSVFFNFHYAVILLFIIIASFAGNVAGYWFGYKTGPAMFKWKDGFFFKRKYLTRAKEFYEHYGNGTIFFAKFLPIIRTFAPPVAGIVQMPKKNFILYNIAGSICWVTLMILGGHFLQSWIDKKFGFSLKDHLGLITIIIVLITTLPILYKLLFRKKKKMLNPAIQQVK